MATQARLSEVADLAAQWEQLTGYSIEVTDAMVQELASNLSVQTMFDIGQYFARDPNYTARLNTVPWSQYGMTATEYSTKAQTFDSTFLSLTGQDVPQDILDRALKQNRGTMTGAQLQTWLLAQDNIKSTYGWLRYGLNFQQFQQQKLSMNQAFGLPLSDAEAVAQLQYMHAAQGPNVSAAAQPTLTQVEKKQAQVGAGQSVVR